MAEVTDRNEPEPSDGVAELMAELANPDEWGAPEPSKRPKSEKRRRHVVVSVRMTGDEVELIEAGAAHSGIPLGTYLRECALRESSRHAVVVTHARWVVAANGSSDVHQPRTEVTVNYGYNYSSVRSLSAP